MKEIISLSLGPSSNFTFSHFWNFHDEWMKQGDDQLLSNNPILFYETQSSKFLVPRTIYIDFRNNFGNYLSVFNHEASHSANKQ